MRVVVTIDKAIDKSNNICSHDNKLDMSTMGGSKVSKYMCQDCGIFWEESVDVAETIREIETAGK